ncbi:MAG: T9SS type A sorting domain-containing protein [Ignavibacteria bacterium]|nr:T9SS type A sorting domain-containing protein [Ignavibacteria bacterium]
MKKVVLILSLIFIASQFLLSQDGPNAWSVNFGINARIFTLAINPQNQNVMYFGSLDSGVYKSTNGGLNWAPANNGMIYNKVQCLAISASNPNIIFAGTDSLGGWTNSGIYKSTDAGANWTLVSADIYDTKGIQAIVVHPTNPNIVVCGVFNALAASVVGIWKSTNGGINWSPSSTGVDNKQILSLIVNPKNPNVMYAGSSLVMPGSTGPSKIYRSNDAGSNWTAVTNGLPTGATTGNPIRCMSISPTDTAKVLAAIFVNDTTGGIYVTTNGGQLWSKKWGIPNTTGTLPRSAVINPLNPNEFYVGVDQSGGTGSMGIWRTTDGGATWADFSGGSLLNSYTIRALLFKTLGNLTLFAGGATSSSASGRGTFEYTWTALGIYNPEVPVKFNLDQNYPNPFNPSTSIKFDIPKSSFIKLAVYDIIGRELRLLINDYRNAGSYIVNFEAGSLSSGVYIYRLESGNFISEKRMIIVK